MNHGNDDKRQNSRWEHIDGDSCTPQFLAFRSIDAWLRTSNSNFSTIGCHNPGADGHSGKHLHLIANPSYQRKELLPPYRELSYM